MLVGTVEHEYGQSPVRPVSRITLPAALIIFFPYFRLETETLSDAPALLQFTGNSLPRFVK
jgi:hypothetical protein